MPVISFALPKLSATMEEGVVVRWLKSPGDAVAAGEPLVELETDKAVIEVESPVTGRLAAILAAEGAAVPVGGEIARFETEARVPAARAESAGPGPAGGAPAGIKPGGAGGADEARPGEEAAGARRPVSPAARRRARELGIDLDAVTGTGPGGRVVVEDVEKAAARAGLPGRAAGGVAETERAAAGEPTGPREAAAEAAVHAAGAPPVAARAAAYERVRRGVIETVTRSHREIPAFWVERWVDLERAYAFKTELDKGRPGTKVTLTDFFLQAIADVLPSHPRLCARLVSAEPLREEVESDPAVGLVVRVPGGVVVPTLAGLRGLGLVEVSRLRSGAVEAARSGRLASATLAPAAVSLSNVGNAGVDVLRPMILPGQTAVIGVGRAHERVVPRERAIAIRMGCFMVLAADHRVVDGVEAAEFLGALAERIEKGEWRA